jgi:hypothetical protein
MQSSENSGIRGVVFDSALDSFEQVLALGFALGLQAKGELRLVSASISRPDLEAAAFCEVLQRFYGGGQPADGPELYLPVGMVADGDATSGPAAWQPHSKNIPTESSG